LTGCGEGLNLAPVQAVVLRVGLGGAAVACVAALVASAGAAGHAPAAGSLPVSIPLPALNSDEVKVVTLKVTGAKGKLSVRTTNNAKLGNESIVYVVAAPAKPRVNETVKVYVLVKRFGTARRTATANEDGLSFAVIDEDKAVREYGPVKNAECADLRAMNSVFEHGRHGTSNGEDWALVPGRPSSDQSSDPEEVLDQIVDDVWGGCAGAPETYDSGPS
jgi:hypothetical protein